MLDRESERERERLTLSNKYHIACNVLNILAPLIYSLILRLYPEGNFDRSQSHVLHTYTPVHTRTPVSYGRDIRDITTRTISRNMINKISK